MHKNDWQRFPYFLAVARGKSFRAAADQLSATHGTVIRQITSLEEAYGAKLFQRTRSGPQLTDAGKQLFTLAEEAEILVQRARRQVEGIDQREAGYVRFSTTNILSYEIVAPMLGRFAKAYPNIEIQFQVRNRIEQLTKLETDVSLRFADSIEEDVVARKLLTMHLGVFASQDYIDRTATLRRPNGEGLEWLGWDSVERQPSWIEDSPMPGAQARHACTDPVMQLHMARQGLGMVRTSPIFADIYPELVQVPGTRLQPDKSLWLLLHPDLRHQVPVRRFVDFLAREFRELKPKLVG